MFPPATSRSPAACCQYKKFDKNKPPVLTHGRLARLAESVVGESLHEAGFAHAAGADDDDLKFKVSGSRRHLPAARLSPQSGGRVGGAPAGPGGPPRSVTPRIHQRVLICDGQRNTQTRPKCYTAEIMWYLQLSFVSAEVCESLSLAESCCCCSAIRRRAVMTSLTTPRRTSASGAPL